MKLREFAAITAGLLAVALPLRADDWPQWQGPNRNSISKETGLLKAWPKEGPKLLWTYRDAGVGYSAPAIVGNRLYGMGARDKTEYVYALDVDKGTQIWAASIGPMFTWKGNNWNAGPNATPTVDGKLVFALGGRGELVCVDGDKGQEQWRKSLPKDLNGEVNPIGGNEANLLGWGYCGSPLVDGDQVICVPGGKDGLVAALKKTDGSVLWRSKELPLQATYSSPIVAEVGGVRQYIVMTYEGIAGVAAKDGKLLWNYKREEPYGDVLIPTPIFHENHVYATAWKGGSDLIKLTPGGKDKFEVIYSGEKLNNREGGVVLIGDHIYGYAESNNGWNCQDFKTGAIVWTERRRLKRGSLLAAEGLLYCYDEEGTAALVTATPDKPAWQEKGRFAIPEKSKKNQTNGHIWTHPVLANGRLYLRDQDLLFCYDVREK